MATALADWFLGTIYLEELLEHLQHLDKLMEIASEDVPSHDL